MSTTAEDVYRTATAALGDHFATSPLGCTIRQLRCLICQQLAAAEEDAWFAAHAAVLIARGHLSLETTESPVADERKARAGPVRARQGAGGAGL